MEKMFRVSVIGRIRPGVTREAVKAFVGSKLAEKGILDGDSVRWITTPWQNGKRFYVKFCTIIPADRLDDAWNLKASKFFSDAGFGDVAWKITPVKSDDPDPENTTCSIPADLFQIMLGEYDENEKIQMPKPPEPFGSDRFWMWFEDVDE
jgi:hypothetical protein